MIAISPCLQSSRLWFSDYLDGALFLLRANCAALVIPVLTLICPIRYTSLFLIHSLFLLSCGPGDRVPEGRKPDPIISDVSLYAKSGNRFARDLLARSLELGTSFLLHNQEDSGNFQHEYNFVKGRHNPSDSQVRQIGALWGLSLIH